MSNQKAIILAPPVNKHYGDTQFYQPPILVGPLTLKPPKFKIKTHSQILTSFSDVSKQSFPKKFDVRDQLPGNLTHVLNQGQCGSCWTFSSATAASDIFTRVQLNENANIKDGIRISPMSFFNLSNKVLQDGKSVLNGCDGGIPGTVLSYMENNKIPLVSERCQDYSWYVSSINKLLPKNINTDSLNSSWNNYTSQNITSNGTTKCFENPSKGEHHQFFVKNVNTPPITKNQPQNLTTDLSSFLTTAISNQAIIKNHLMKHGSVVCGIPVFTGFMSGGGNLSINGQSPDKSSWIVADHINNLADGNVYVQSKTDLKHEGGHAVTIVGWGNNQAVAKRSGLQGGAIEKKLKELGGDLGNYWIIRNSWGYSWPNGDTTNSKLAGYFCLAMYPVNIHVQVSYPYQDQDSGLFSVFTTFEPDIVCSDKCEKKLLANEPQQLFKDLNKISNPNKQDSDWSGYLADGKKYYESTDTNYKEYTSPSSNQSNSFTKYLPYIIGCVVLFAIFATLL